MGRKKRAARQGFTKYRIGPDDLVTVSGIAMRYSREYAEGVVLKSANDNGALVKAYDWRRIEAMLRDGWLEIDRGHFSESRAIERAVGWAKGFEADAEKTLRARMAAEFLAQETGESDWPHEICHRSDDDIERFHAIFQSENAQLVDEARLSVVRKGKKKLFVGPRQFRRLLERFEEAELDPGSMVDRYPGGGTPGSTLEKDDLDYALGFVASARTPDRPTVKSAFEAMIRDDTERMKDGKPRFRTVSQSTFQRMYNEGNDYLNDVGRSDSTHAVARKYIPKIQGLQVTRPLQVVEMDEHLVHLMKMLVKNDVFHRLHEDVQIRIRAMGRVWLSVAMDAYSRSIVGMKVLRGAPDAEAAVATLAMVAQRKDKLSALLGAQTRWPQCGTPEAVHTDAGAGYVAAKFELAAMMFTKRHRIPPSKHPHLRGRIERFFRTLNQRYIHLFSGQTFSNPLMKGEYDPEKYAHVTDEEFADLIGRLIVDCYHNTKHRGIGMTPLEAWERGSQLAGGAIAPPPSARKYREIFGATVTRSIGNSGIEIAGNIYSNSALLEIRKKWFRAKLLVRVNEEDISMISVKHRRRNAWVDVPAAFAGLKGVTLDEWRETIRYVERHLGTKKVHSEEAIATALKAVRQAIALSKQRSGILVHDSIEKKLAALESTMSPAFKYSQQQDYDYASYDDGVDHENDVLDGEDEDAAAERMRAAIATAPPPERYVQPLPAGGNPFNPGAGTASFDRSGFVSDNAAVNRESGVQGKTKSNRRKLAVPAASPDSPVEAYRVVSDPDGADARPLPATPKRKSIRITGLDKPEGSR
ncbi:putative transposase [Rhizobium sp. PP-CC-2G-626]|nr:putative transposase [Rhizobium sp. PP-CC-2G-626]